MKKLFNINIFLLIAVILFISAGLYHLTKFETTDEHFWKYERIEKYIDAFKDSNLKKTRINDKPGVTVALTSGIGYLISPSLLHHRDIIREQDNTITKQNGKRKKLYTLYDTSKTKELNLALRLPILLFTGLLMLPLLFWLMKKAFTERIASLGIILISTNPILIGISQIINPDALLWSFSTGAILSFIVLLKRKERKFLIITGVLTGFALLSKYTANLLFLFYAIIYITQTTISQDTPSLHTLKKTLLLYVKKIIPITLISWLTLLIFMPAAFITSKHFFYATTYSPVLKPLTDLFIPNQNSIFITLFSNKTTLHALSLIFFLIFFALLPPMLSFYLRNQKKVLILIGKVFIISTLLLFILSFINAWFDTPLFPLLNTKETSRDLGVLSFPQLANEPILLFWVKSTLIQAQNFIFSLNPLIILSLCTLFISVLFQKKLHKNSWFIYFSAIIPFIFFIGGTISNIFVNARYSLMLYPIFMIIGAISILFIYDLIKYKYKYLLLLILVSTTTLTSLWNIKPFYLNYLNYFLPNQYVVTDSWGYGFYEAAQYLNNLEDAENIIVWSDRGGLSQFFVGKNLNSRKIYLDHSIPDYLVLTRRGSISKRPIAISNTTETANISFAKYYTSEYFDTPLWTLHIGGRPGNFIKIIKVEK